MTIRRLDRVAGALAGRRGAEFGGQGNPKTRGEVVFVKPLSMLNDRQDKTSLTVTFIMHGAICLNV